MLPWICRNGNCKGVQKMEIREIQWRHVIWCKVTWWIRRHGFVWNIMGTPLSWMVQSSDIILIHFVHWTCCRNLGYTYSHFWAKPHGCESQERWTQRMTPQKMGGWSTTGWKPGTSPRDCQEGEAASLGWPDRPEGGSRSIPAARTLTRFNWMTWGSRRPGLWSIQSYHRKITQKSPKKGLSWQKKPIISL